MGMLIEQKYGGHLGFHEGGFLNPNTLTWLDRTVVNLANSLSTYIQSEGRRPDLKVIEDIGKQPNIIPVADATNGMETEEDKKADIVPNLNLKKSTALFNKNLSF